MGSALSLLDDRATLTQQGYRSAHIRKYVARLTPTEDMDSSKMAKWEFPEEFLHELAAAQTHYTLRVAGK